LGSRPKKFDLVTDMKEGGYSRRNPDMPLHAR
jgi:hypothetical protein